MSQVPMSLTEVATDILDHVPTGSVFKFAIQQVFKKRIMAAREILLEEIKNGNKEVLDSVDEMVAIVYRYSRAAQEGAARINLRLMAQVISGKNVSENLTANRFLYYADIISSLRLEEIKLIGIMIREGATYSSKAKKALVEHFSEERLTSIYQSLIRTGLFLSNQGVDAEYKEYDSGHLEGESFVGTQKWIESEFWVEYEFTPLMEEICRYVAFEDALEREQDNQ